VISKAGIIIIAALGVTVSFHVSHVQAATSV